MAEPSGERPTGTVTFLFTDLEGSTRLWEQHPEAMKAALARHDEILREAVESHGGHVVKTTGDGVHAAFADAADALTAGIDAQQRLTNETWPLPEPLRVRMGIHTGAAEHREGDYYGPAVNRAARIMSAANGGQILTSLATEEVVSEALPSGLELVDLGEHRLRDLARPQRIFQVVAAGLHRDFPPIRSIDAFPGNLPAQLTSFIGRDEDVAGIAKALDEHRLVTILGTGGMGKTRLAIQVAAELLTRFPDGAWLCELASARDADSMMQSVASTLTASERRGMSLAETVVDFLSPKRLLLVLDNCEQIHTAAGELAASILRSCPHVKILATSRQPIEAPGEQQWPLRPLGLPAGDADATSMGDVEAVRLFVDRARSVRPGFSLDDANAAAVGEICHRLDGMPLALELAAARIGVLGPTEIASRLVARFRLLRGGGHDERHQTLTATIDWSYSMLDETQQHVFDRLGVFPASFAADAAMAVASSDGIDDGEVLDALEHLVEQSMVTAEPGPDGAMRYELLETLRQYALEQLGDNAERWRWRHAEQYVSLARATNTGVMTSEELEWRQRFDLEVENLRAVMSWGVESEDDEAAALVARMVADIGWLAATGPWRVGEWAKRVIERGIFPSEGCRCTIFGAAAHAALSYGDYEESRALAREALRNGLPADAPVPHIAFNALACSTAVIGDIHEAMETFSVAVESLEAIDAGAVDRLVVEGSAAMVEGAYGWYEAAEARARRVLPLARSTGNRSALVVVLVALAWASLDSDPEGALAVLDEAIILGRIGVQHPQHGIALSMAAELRCRRGDIPEAIEALRETVMVNSDSGDRGMLITALERSVPVLVDAGQLETAMTIAGAVRGPFNRVGHLPASERARFQDAFERATRALGTDATESATTHGDSMTLDELVIYSLSELDRIRSELADA